MALPGLMAGLVACSTAPYSYIPYPDTVYVPRPDEVDSDLSREQLREMYTTSPNRDPDGRGELYTLWTNSTMVLMAERMYVLLEEENRIAYARTDAEQQRVLDRLKVFFQERLLISGYLLSNLPEGAQAEWYFPEGIYLLDDRGRKFLPFEARERSGKSILARALRSEFGLPGDYLAGSRPAIILPEGVHLLDAQGNKFQLEHSEKTEVDRIRPNNNVDSFVGYPVLIFPKEAITAGTKAITLYFAYFGRRMSFTWIFDHNYVPNRRRESREHGEGFERMWRNQ